MSEMCSPFLSGWFEHKVGSPTLGFRGCNLEGMSGTFKRGHELSTSREKGEKNKSWSSFKSQRGVYIRFFFFLTVWIIYMQLWQSLPWWNWSNLTKALKGSDWLIKLIISCALLWAGRLPMMWIPTSCLTASCRVPLVFPVLHPIPPASCLWLWMCSFIICPLYGSGEALRII